MAKKILNMCKKFLDKTKKSFDRQEDYILLHLTPDQISFQLMKGKRVVESAHASFSRMHKILKQISTMDVPIQLILKDWDLNSKQLNFSNMIFFDRMRAKRNFIAGEFSAQDTVICKKSSVQKNTYIFVGLQHNYQLDQALNNIASLNNAIKKIQLFEIGILHKVMNTYYQKQSAGDSKWFALLTESNKRWRLLIGNSYDLVYSRFLEQTPSKHFQNDLMQDLIETMHYLPRLGFQEKQPLMLLAKKGLFKNDPVMKKNQIHFKSVTNMGSFLTLHEGDESRKHSFLNWIGNSISMPNFFWNRLSYTLPKFSILILLPVLFGLAIYATYLSINTAIYFQKIDKLDETMKNLSLLYPGTNQNLKSFKYFEYFKTRYQKSPALILKNVMKLTNPYMKTQAIHWMKRDQNFVLDGTFISRNNLSQKNIDTMQKGITHKSPHKIQHLSFHPSDAQGAKIISLNISGAE